jgi:hypothetical protein
MELGEMLGDPTSSVEDGESSDKTPLIVTFSVNK